MLTILAVVGLGVLFPLVFRLADKLGDHKGLVAVLTRLHLL
jgi:hypothetical protein